MKSIVGLYPAFLDTTIYLGNPYITPLTCTKTRVLWYNCHEKRQTEGITLISQPQLYFQGY